MDPIKYKSSEKNLYLLTGNSPAKYTDYQGLDRYLIGHEGGNYLDITNHSRVAVDTWKCTEHGWINTGAVTYELGPASSGALDIFTGLGIFFVPEIRITPGINTTPDSIIHSPKEFRVIKSNPCQDIKLLEELNKVWMLNAMQKELGWLTDSDRRAEWQLIHYFHDYSNNGAPNVPYVFGPLSTNCHMFAKQFAKIGLNSLHDCKCICNKVN